MHIISRITSHIYTHVKRKRKVKQENKTKLTDLNYIGDKDHNDSK